MKQVNVLMDEELLEHLEKLAQIISLMCDKKITVSDVVRKSVKEYSKYGQVIIESKLTENKVEINCYPSKWEKSTDGGFQLPNDELMQKVCMEEW